MAASESETRFACVRRHRSTDSGLLHRPWARSRGTELVNDEVIVNDPPFAFELHGTCAYTRDFDCSG